MHQPNADDCRVFALAMATELAYGGDPAVCKWDVETMRQHLLKCLEVGKIERFPQVGKRRLGLGSRVLKTIHEKLFCVCRLPNQKDRPMIACDSCKQWFHKDCMGLDPIISYKDEDWKCISCSSMLKHLTC